MGDVRLAILVTSDHFTEAQFILLDDPDNDNNKQFLLLILSGAGTSLNGFIILKTD